MGQHQLGQIKKNTDIFERSGHMKPMTKNIRVKLPWIFPGAPLKINGAPRKIQGNLTGVSSSGLDILC